MFKVIINFIGRKINKVAYMVDSELATQISLGKLNDKKVMLCNKIAEVETKYGKDNPKFKPYVDKMRAAADKYENRISY